MKNILLDIREKLEAGEYRNEEHIRLNLVCRLLESLGWNIWDPNIVYPEFYVAPNEDNNKVDLALFLQQYLPPSVYIEIKNIGVLPKNRSDVEKQLRDYNRNNTAQFSIITNGRFWYFYFSQTGGEFSNKCFKEIDLINQDIDDIELSLWAFLSKEEIEKGNSKSEAEKYLKLSQEQKILEDCLPQARRMIQEPPFLPLPDCLANLVQQKGLSIAREKLVEFAINSNKKVDNFASNRENILRIDSIKKAVNTKTNVSNIEGSLTYSKIAQSEIDGFKAKNWRQLYRLAVELSIKKGLPIREVESLVGGGIREGYINERGYAPLDGYNMSIQDVDAPKCFYRARALSEKMGMKLHIIYCEQNGNQIEVNC
jgi:hypothetical protein